MADEGRARIRVTAAPVLAEARRGTLRPPIAAAYDLTDIHRAQEEFSTRRHVGKIVVRP
ncbi:zinc-binding dehydrogenase [Nocardia flavorosea]|uniref:Zinc-binding dehydrogenase n=1 Tax=Nocardia flavorosea TaxID=53429 RepID=A0A846YM39_9NOCA|nr:zinc-binding dehydrogenase [Nocardia flavorosea]NKY60736.1 zinc-binding dehydrogenase [Nocardia flavorosea]